MCVANVKYKKPTQNESRRMKNLLRYLTYRDSRDDYVPQAAGQERWVDRGMGRTVAQIARRCEAYQSDHVLLFSLVINPNPALVEMIPHDEREQFVRNLTEWTVEDFFGARGIDTGVEYAWVLHHRQTEDDESPGRHNPHAHVVLPGTYYNADEGRRVPLYFNQNKRANHIELLHTLTEQNMEMLMEHYVGREWEQQYDALHPQLEITVDDGLALSLDL
jgi:hypothetical protein